MFMQNWIISDRPTSLFNLTILMIPVILSGGSGTRLWPLSRSQYPKQFLPLVSNYTMLQETWRRLAELPTLQKPIVVCNAQHRFIVAEQLREIDAAPSAIILEPIGKNTAPAVTLAALAAHQDDVLLVLPSDHVILNIDAFQTAVQQAELLALQNYLVTFGITPITPETGYGYIKYAESLDNQVYSVIHFIEKPDAERAQIFVNDGGYLWNSGMFAFKAGSFLKELAKFNPTMLAVCQQAFDTAQRDTDFIRINADIFKNCPADSIDYAVMEKTRQALVIKLDAGWDDIGSWSALWQVTPKDEQGNALRGDILAIDTHDSFIYAEHKLITTIGLQDFVVIETSDALMVAPKNRLQDIKRVVEQLKQAGRSEVDIHYKTYRAWGYYEIIDLGASHKIKRIVVKPGAKISLQMHHYRSEHWIVVKGSALISKGEQQLLLSENQSTFIPLGIVHQLENCGLIPLEIIEVQSGSYLGEDDIVRFSDHDHWPE